MATVALEALRRGRTSCGNGSEMDVGESSIRSRLENLIALAHLLERVEAGVVKADADQYRFLIRQLQAALEVELPHDALSAILRAHPAASELYENLHYQHAGLSRAPLERSVSTEALTQQILARIAARRSTDV